MKPAIRISTTPPDEWSGREGEASYYYDLCETDDWRSSPMLREIPEAFSEEGSRCGVAGYAVLGVHANFETGLLICVRDAEQGLAYLGEDRSGRTDRQAANEALWDVANAARPHPNAWSDAGAPEPFC